MHWGGLDMRSYIKLKICHLRDWQERPSPFRGTPDSEMSCANGKRSGEMKVAATSPVATAPWMKSFHASEPVQGAKGANHCGRVTALMSCRLVAARRCPFVWKLG